MNKMKIKLNTPDDMTEFVNRCMKYSCDINIYDGSVVLDAKSIIGVFAISSNKIVEVQIISSNESVILSFIEDMKKFEV